MKNETCGVAHHKHACQSHHSVTAETLKICNHGGQLRVHGWLTGRAASAVQTDLQHMHVLLPETAPRKIHQKLIKMSTILEKTLTSLWFARC